MKILIYGAGVIGSLYAAKMQESGQHVSILARGQRLADLREHGIVLEDRNTGECSTTHVDVVDRLTPGDAYDLVVVIIPKNHISEVLPILAENKNTPNVLFMCNNAAGPGEMINALGSERVLLGFPGVGGIREGHVVRYYIVSKSEQPTTFGELDGKKSKRLELIVKVFKNAGFPVSISSNIDAWLKTHAAEILPTANALYMAGIDNYRLAKTLDGLILMVRAIREGYNVLKALGVPITPSKHKIFKWLPEPILIYIMRSMLRDEKTELKIGHAKAARDEMKHLANEFKALAQNTTISTPAMDRLNAYLDPNVKPVPEGSSKIPMSWSGMCIGFGILIVLATVIILLL